MSLSSASATPRTRNRFPRPFPGNHAVTPAVHPPCHCKMNAADFRLNGRLLLTDRLTTRGPRFETQPFTLLNGCYRLSKCNRRRNAKRSPRPIHAVEAGVCQMHSGADVAFVTATVELELRKGIVCSTWSRRGPRGRCMPPRGPCSFCGSASDERVQVSWIHRRHT